MSERAVAPAGAQMRILDERACARLLEWLLRGGEAPQEASPDLRWALAHLDDGVTWGRFDAAEGRWRLGSEIKPTVSPPVRRERLQQLRLFGPAAEILVWRDGERFCGRILADNPNGADLDKVLRPYTESRILLGDHVVEQLPGDFTHVGDRAGLQQVLPLAVTNDDLQHRRARLQVRHYWEQDAESGAVRIRATRLVDVFIEGE